MWTKSLLLYRNHYLRHGKDVMIGYVFERGDLPAGRYVHLEPEAIGESDGNYLILHRDPSLELARYWVFATHDPGVDSPTHAPETPTRTAEVERLEQVSASVRAGLRKPVYRDEQILVWKLR